MSHNTMHPVLTHEYSALLVQVWSSVYRSQKLKWILKAHHVDPPSPAVELLRLSAAHRDPISGNSSELVTIVRSFKLANDRPSLPRKSAFRAA